MNLFRFSIEIIWNYRCTSNVVMSTTSFKFMPIVHRFGIWLAKLNLLRKTFWKCFTADSLIRKHYPLRPSDVIRKSLGFTNFPPKAFAKHVVVILYEGPAQRIKFINIINGTLITLCRMVSCPAWLLSVEGCNRYCLGNFDLSPQKQKQPHDTMASPAYYKAEDSCTGDVFYGFVW